MLQRKHWAILFSVGCGIGGSGCFFQDQADCTINLNVPCGNAGGNAGGNAECGNGDVEEGEACDDGNLSSGDGCGSGCSVEPGWKCASLPTEAVESVCHPSCGDGTADENELCDDGNTRSG